MIVLDKSSGNVNFENFIISKNFTINEVKELEKIHIVIPTIKNAGYTSFAIQNINNGENSLILTFFENLIITVQIALGTKYVDAPYEITNNMRSRLKSTLKSLGGEKKYSWGSVQLIEDFKGGIISIAVGFDNPQKKQV